MPASVPVSVMFEMTTGLSRPRSSSLNNAVLLMENRSPSSRSSEYVTVAMVVASYVLSFATAVTTSGRRVIVAVVVAVVFGV